MNAPSPLRCSAATLKECCTNIACAPFFLLAILFYAFYYCWPYMAQLPEHLTAAIADEDDSPLSRRLTAALRATPRLNIIRVVADRDTAVALMRAGDVVSVIGIPPGFEKDTLNDVPTALTLVTNGSFIVKARTSMSGASEPLAEVATAAISAHLVQHGAQASALAGAALRPPALVIQPMYNTIAGYLNFAVPIVFVIIFQTLMICGTGMLLNDWFSRPQPPETLRLACAWPRCLAAVQLPVFGLCLFWTLAVEGAIFALHGINSSQNIPATLLVCVFFSFAVTSLGMLVGLGFGASRYVIQAVVTSSIPCVFITGNLFPTQNIPWYMRMLSWLLPSTPGANGMLRASQAGATPNEVYPYLAHLLALGLLYFSLAVLLARWRGRRLPGGTGTEGGKTAADAALTR